jgi:hypothetical protein
LAYLKWMFLFIFIFAKLYLFFTLKVSDSVKKIKRTEIDIWSIGQKLSIENLDYITQSNLYIA